MKRHPDEWQVLNLHKPGWVIIRTGDRSEVGFPCLSQKLLNQLARAHNDIIKRLNPP